MILEPEAFPVVCFDGFLGCRAVVAAVREAVESRRVRRLRRRCCAANPPLGPWCVVRAVEEAVPVPGQLLWVTPASWLKAPKRRRRGRRTSLSSALGEGGRGRRRAVKWQGKLPVLNSAARGNCCPHAGAARVGLQSTESGKGRERCGRGRSGLSPRLLRSCLESF